MNRTEIKEAREKRKAKHIEQLESLGLLPVSFSKLRRIEKAANRAALYYCNDEGLDGKPYGEKDYDRDISRLRKRLKQLFVDGLPEGFFFNSDPRGYALKIKSEVNTLDQRDWGGYGLLAPDDDNF